LLALSTNPVHVQQLGNAQVTIAQQSSNDGSGLLLALPVSQLTKQL